MLTKGWLLHIALAMVLVIEASSQDCGQLLTRLREANQAHLELLNSKMGSTQQCNDDLISYSPKEDLPTNIGVSEEENVKAAIQEALQQTGHIFRQNSTAMAWDEDSISAFRAGLDQQSENLKSCLSASPRSQRTQLTRLKVKRYFRSLSDLLKEKAYSWCAWEIVQIQVKQCFLWIEMIMVDMLNLMQAKQMSETSS